MSDDLPTCDQVMEWLPRDIRDAITMALTPEQRGWYTAAEADADGGRFVEVQTMSEATPRYWRTGD